MGYYMKKIIPLSIIAIAALILAVISCTFSKAEDDNLDPAPVVITNGIDNIVLTFSVGNKKNVNYINVYRQDVTDEDNPGEKINIGIIYPNNQGSELDGTASFTDMYFVKGNKYIYSARFTTNGTDEGKNISSYWTKETAPVSNTRHSHDSIKDMMYSDSNGTAYFEYDENNYTLTIKGGDFQKPSVDSDPTAPIFTPCVVLSSKTEEKEIKRAYTMNNIKSDTVLSLSILLANDFKEGGRITIDGVIGMGSWYTEGVLNSEKGPEFLFWTEPLKVTLKNASGTTLTGFDVKSSDVASGLDYSDN